MWYTQIVNVYIIKFNYKNYFFIFSPNKMSKRLIEFNCGDPKSNQQTASKVDCQITINNSQISKKSKPKKQTERNVKLVNEIEVFDSESSEDTETQPVIEKTFRNEEFNTKVNIPVKSKSRSIPSSTERFVMVSRQPIVTSEEIENNIEFHKKRAEILTNTLCLNDKKLVANLIDRSGKVIISAQEFCELVAIMLSNEESQVNPSDIGLTLQEEVLPSCLKVHISPFKQITSIKINNQDFHNIQNEAYNTLTDIYKISVNTVYVTPFFEK